LSWAIIGTPDFVLAGLARSLTHVIGRELFVFAVPVPATQINSEARPGVQWRNSRRLPEFTSSRGASR
jgi:hypothetical protein